MSTTEIKTVEVIKDRICRILIEKPNNQPASLITVHENIIDGVSTITGNMYSTFNSENPLDIALEAALRTKVDEMRTIRDTPPIADIPII